MASYALYLNGNLYSTLLANAVLGSEAYTALLGALRPTPTNLRGIVCSEKAVWELLLTAERSCPEAAVEISKQFERQKSRSE
jgi:hypothetical protein